MFKKIIISTISLLMLAVLSVPVFTWARENLAPYSAGSEIGAHYGGTTKNVPSLTFDLNRQSPPPQNDNSDPNTTSSFPFDIPFEYVEKADPFFLLFFWQGEEFYYDKEYSKALKQFEYCGVPKYQEYLTDETGTNSQEKMYFFLLQSLCYEKLDSQPQAIESFKEAVKYGVSGTEVETAEEWRILFSEEINNKFYEEDISIINYFLEEPGMNDYINQAIETSKLPPKKPKKVDINPYEIDCFIQSLTD